MGTQSATPLGRVRFAGERLAMPGVLGVVEAPGVHYVQRGVDAGWPVFRPMNEWKTHVLLVEVRALTLEAREVLEEDLPDVALAQALASNADMESYELPPPHDEDALLSLRLAAASRLLIVSETESRALHRLGIPIYKVGYSRYLSQLDVDLVGSVEPPPARIDTHDVLRLQPRHPPPPPKLSSEQYSALFLARWMDRAIQALTFGTLTEGAMQFARCCHRGLEGLKLVEDEIARGLQVAADQMAAGAEYVIVPPTTRARRVTLPAVELPVTYADPIDPEGPPTQGRLSLPAEDCWLVVGS